MGEVYAVTTNGNGVSYVSGSKKRYFHTHYHLIAMLEPYIKDLRGVVLYGATVDVAVYGALAGILSTGLYELFGKGIKNVGKTLEKRGGISNTEDDK